jgi:lipoprotein-anchoring transpeptidase ErfK/SrfK
MLSHLSRGGLVTALAAIGCLLVAGTIGVAARDGGSKPRRDGAAVAVESRDDAARAEALAAAVRIAPTSGTTDVTPDRPIVVRASAGQLAKVRVASEAGTPVAGRLAPTRTTWQSTEKLAYNTTYRVVALVSDAEDARAKLTSSFRTVAPPDIVTTSVFPSEGLSVGVGQPVVFRFDRDITDPGARAELLRHIDVIQSQPVLGGWHWFSDHELHYRPKEYWPANTQLAVTWDLRGWNAGGPMWGDGQGAVRFSIGDARVSYADLASHRMNVTLNGKVVASYPISGGKPTDPTMNGTHIVLDRASVVRMNSATNGVPVDSPDGYDELVYWDVHISDSGEYVHAAPWSEDSQGVANVSHGCINLSEANAKAYFEFSRVGDVLLVGGGPRPPELGDHGVMDWDTDWSDFTPANALPRVPAGLASLH